MPTYGDVAKVEANHVFMDQTMTRADLISVLEGLRYDRRGEARQTIQIDRPVAVFLINALRAK